MGAKLEGERGLTFGYEINADKPKVQMHWANTEPPVVNGASLISTVKHWCTTTTIGGKNELMGVQKALFGWVPTFSLIGYPETSSNNKHQLTKVWNKQACIAAKSRKFVRAAENVAWKVFRIPLYRKNLVSRRTALVINVQLWAKVCAPWGVDFENFFLFIFAA